MKSKLFVLFASLSWIFSVIVISSYLFSANVPFWYDPARDMLSAWANLSKITLIGPTSGIPGFFYGPYWIWWLSFGQLFSKNPVIVTAITMAIPYLFGFFAILLLFSRVFGKWVSILLWMVFFITYSGYMTQLWNPYLAPLLFLSVIYLVVFYTEKTNTLAKYAVFAAGILAGIALNVHISFSVGFTIGCILYFLIRRKNSFLSILLFLVGVFLAFIPFFLFEIRHGFHQTRIAMQAFLHGGDVVLQHGLSKQEIFYQFFLRLSQLLHAPFFLSICLLVVSTIIYVGLYFKQKWELTFREKSLLLLISTITCSVLGIYLVAKNPIWEYHFFGAEVLWLLLIGLYMMRVKFFVYLFSVWVLVLSFGVARDVVNALQVDPLTRGSLYTKEYIVKTIQHDAEKKEYTVYAYSPSIYTYEYNYLFRWMTGKEFSYDPGKIEKIGVVYLILPPGKKTNLDDFIHFRTPDALYKTVYTWHIPDGTMILKREQKMLQ